MTTIHLNIKQLRTYLLAIKDETNLPKTNIYEYIENNRELFGIIDHTKIFISLKDIDFSKEGNNTDLSGANLSGTILDGVYFDSKHVMLRNTNLIGCRMNGTAFTGQISLDGTEFGPIELDRDIFQYADLSKAKYDSTNSNKIMVPPTEECLTRYFSLEDPKPNLNQYLNDNFGYRYQGKEIIADLSGRTINEKYNNADISGANLTDARITGEITDLQIRDCITSRTLFIDCHLHSPDLRGTSLANKGTVLYNDFEAARFGSEVIFTDGKFSINKDLIKAEGYTI